MKKYFFIPFLALVILNLNFSSEPDNLTIQNVANAQSSSGFELGIEYPEGNNTGCYALCGGPGSDCIIQGQYLVSCKE
jgi:hypothetical protein